VKENILTQRRKVAKNDILDFLCGLATLRDIFDGF